METSNRLEVRVVDTCEDFYTLKQDWNTILSTLEEPPPFLTWEWLYTWWQIYKTNRTKLIILLVLDNGTVIAIAPLYIRAQVFPVPLKTIYFLGTGEPENKEVCSEYLDLISFPAYSKEASGKIFSYLMCNQKRWDRLTFHRILKDSVLLRYFISYALKGRYKVVKRACGFRYFVDLPTQWEEYLQTLKPSMRRSITVAQKKLQARSNFNIEIVRSEDKIEPLMQELEELHTKSWQMKGKQGAFASREFCEFHLKISHLFYKNNMLQMMKISFPEAVLGVLYNFRISKTSYYYQSGLNMEEFASLKPGVLLHSQAIKNSIAEKFHRYDFMMANANTYKSHYQCQTMSMFYISVWNKGIKSWLLQKLALVPYIKSII